MTVLGIDTSGKTASVAVMRDGTLLGEHTLYTKLTHSQITLPLLKQLVSDCGLALSDIDLVAVSDGPGSYTGLRIGIAAVKGICFTDKKCVGISTLEALAYNCLDSNAVILSILAARPGVVYFGAYDSDGESINPLIPDKVISLDDMTELVKDIDKDIILVGDCAEAVKAKYFTADSRVRLSSPATRLQKASSVCLAALNHSDEWGNAESLNARYLQITKAEKDLIDGNLKH